MYDTDAITHTDTGRKQQYRHDTQPLNAHGTDGSVQIRSGVTDEARNKLLLRRPRRADALRPRHLARLTQCRLVLRAGGPHHPRHRNRELRLDDLELIGLVCVRNIRNREL